MRVRIAPPPLYTWGKALRVSPKEEAGTTATPSSLSKYCTNAVDCTLAQCCYRQEGNELMFLSEWRELPSAPCLAGKKKLDDSSRLDVVDIARVPDMLPSLFPSWSG